MSESPKRDDLFESLRLHEEASRMLRERLRPIQLDPTLRTMLEMQRQSMAQAFQPSADLIHEARRQLKSLSDLDLGSKLRDMSIAFKMFEENANLMALAESMRPIAFKPELLAGVENVTRALNTAFSNDVLRSITAMVDNIASKNLLGRIQSLVGDAEILDRVGNIPFVDVINAVGNQDWSYVTDEIVSSNKETFLSDTIDCFNGNKSFKDICKSSQLIVILIYLYTAIVFNYGVYCQLSSFVENEKPYVQEHDTPSPVKLRVIAESLNLRINANANSSIITALNKGTELELLEKSATTWVKVRVKTADGPLEGWVNGKHTVPADSPRIGTSHP